MPGPAHHRQAAGKSGCSVRRHPEGVLPPDPSRILRLPLCPHSSGTLQKNDPYRGEKYGLSAGNLLFTSDIGYPLGFPRESVLELFQLSNLFICPSYSESFGLTVLEAASRGNFLVLNQAVPALQELGEKLGAYFLRWDARNFGFNTRETYNPSEQAYYEDHGRDILRRMDEDPALSAKSLVRTHYSHRWAMENQLLPLLKG